MNESMEAPVLHKETMCCAVSMAYNFCTLKGEVVLAEGCCGDMSSCINLFKAIDPRVREIQTYRGEKAARLFRKEDDGWTPVDTWKQGVKKGAAHRNGVEEESEEKEIVLEKNAKESVLEF
jgi:hypothetical protein